MPTPIFTPASSRPLLLAAALMLFGASVQAQTAAPAQKNEKNCQASTQSANGNTKDANLDGTYSACSLSNGFIGAGTRTNDGTNKTPEFDGGVSDQEFRNASSAENNHRLATRQLPADASTGEPRKALVSNDRDFRFATRDFVASEANRPFDDAAGYRGPGRSYNQGRSGDTQAPLIVSSSLGEGLPTGSNGVGGGGSGGGFTGGSIIPVTPDIPAVPEPETYAMLLAGLGLVALARRRKSK
ncbi:PEP-CTERM sorting domain-containing protein [Janthinobacterium sp. FW305-129]|uniref:PEP-CTERM sorting domain-containing protein n=1 Tax=Janthinobacterium sp. FW305-129 TaxID=2775054 RepID=UPI001E5A5B08|nr:PEP-CTERM sorting domain-containing protein [Janthinobacterium sp. FW305-129]